MGQCSTKVFAELFEEETDDDSEEWRKQGIRKKTVHSKGVLRSTKGGHGFAVPEFKETDEIKARREMYRFGSRNLSVVNPRDMPNIPEEVQGELELMYAHGFNGRFLTCRQNLYLTHDSSKLLYFIAGVCVSFDPKTNEQTFFKGHNDDVTTICVAPKSLNQPWAASGQKDPKDKGGKNGKDMPKVWIWNYETMEKVQLIDNVCWGKIEKLQWSEKSKYLYCLCGDDDHTLKIYDPNDFDPENPENPIKPIFSEETIKDKIYGFSINPYNTDDSVVDELVLFGKNSFKHVLIRVGFPLMEKTTVSVRKFGNGKGEKSFGCVTWMNNGYYCVGSQSGNIYICNKNKAIKRIEKGHNKSIGDLNFIETQNQIISVGYDDKIKYWKFDGDNKKLQKESEFEIKNLEPRSMAFNHDTKQIFIGNKNNQIIEINEDHTNKIIIDGHYGEIWGLATHPTENIFVTGSHDTSIKIWNAKTKQCIFTEKLPFITSKGKKRKSKKKEIKCKIHCGAWSHDGKLIAVGTLDSYIYVYSYHGIDSAKIIKLQEVLYIPRRSRRAPIEPVTALRFSPDNKILGATHLDSRMYLFDVLYDEDSEEYDLKQWHATMEHIAGCVGLQFGKGQGNDKDEVIKTFTRDYEIVHWIVDREKRDCKFCPWIPAPENITFYNDPLIAGWSVKGCYQHNKGWDGTDLNDIAITKDKKLVISGDDFATIRVHNYPAINERQCNKYINHAEFVVGVKLLFDDSQLISCGGADRTIFQWKLNKLYQNDNNDQEIQEEQDDDEEN